MIIFIDNSGSENVIRNDNIAIDLYKRGSIKPDTLVKTSIHRDWKRADSLELFSSVIELNASEGEKEISPSDVVETSTLEEETIESSASSTESTNESEKSKEETFIENESQNEKDITTSNVDETIITKEEEKEVIESSVPKSKPAQQKTEEFQKNTEKNEKTTEDKEEKSKVIEDLKDSSSNEQVKRKAPETNMTLFKSIKTCYKKYFDFNSRASRSEYWFFQLYFAIIYILWFFIIIESFFFLGIIVLLTIIPVISAQVRRLHDTNHSGWWVLAGTVIPFVSFYVLYLLCVKSDDGRNKYGDYPL